MPYFAVKVNPFGYINQSWNWNPQQYSLEVAWNEKFSGVVYYETGLYREIETYDGHYNFFAPSSRYSETKVSAKGFITEGRYYTSKKRKAPFGFFTGAYFRYLQLKEEYHGSNFDYYPNQLYEPEIDLTNYKDTYNIGILTGYKLSHKYIFAELLFGFGYYFISWEDPDNRNKMNPNAKLSDDDPPMAGRLELAIGFVFPPAQKIKAKND